MNADQPPAGCPRTMPALDFNKMIPYSGNGDWSGCPLNGNAHGVKLSLFNFPGEFFVAPGIRNMALTPDRKTLMVAGYTDGYLYFIDVKSWHVVNKIYLGHRMRALTLSNDGRYVYVGSSQGGFKVELEALSGI